MRQFSASIVTIPQHLPGWQSGHLLLKPKASRKQQRAVIDFLSLLLMGYRLRYTVEIDIWGGRHATIRCCYYFGNASLGDSYERCLGLHDNSIKPTWFRESIIGFKKNHSRIACISYFIPNWMSSISVLEWLGGAMGASKKPSRFGKVEATRFSPRCMPSTMHQLPTVYSKVLKRKKFREAWLLSSRAKYCQSTSRYSLLIPLQGILAGCCEEFPLCYCCPSGIFLFGCVLWYQCNEIMTKYSTRKRVVKGGGTNNWSMFVS